MRIRRPAAALLAATALLTGCGLESANTFTPQAAPAQIQPIPGAEGAEVVVGTKNFTEALILGKIAVIALQSAGFDVTDRSGIPGAATEHYGVPFSLTEEFTSVYRIDPNANW